MRKIAIGCALGLTLTFTSCFSGPHQLRRTVDNWDQKLYVDSPWLNVVLTIIPVIPLAYFGAQIGDFFVSDGYMFWIKDAFTGKGGTGFEYNQVEAKTRWVNSLLSDDGGYLKIQGDTGEGGG